MSGISSNEIRTLVRDALRELLPNGKAAKADPGGSLLARLRAALLEQRSSPVDVKLESSSDLTAFARDIAQASGEQDLRIGIASGKIQFRLAGRPAGPAPKAQRSEHQIAKGVVTELMVTEIGKTSERLIVGKGVVVTPLARDKAREVKLEIVRERS